MNTLNIDVTTTITRDGRIGMVTSLGGEVLSRQVADTQDAQVRMSLKKLGWIEPGRSVTPTIDAARLMGAKGGPTIEEERLAFEAWMAGHCWALGATWNGTEYRGSSESPNFVCPHAMRARQLWAAWRDRAALHAEMSRA